MSDEEEVDAINKTAGEGVNYTMNLMSNLGKTIVTKISIQYTQVSTGNQASQIQYLVSKIKYQPLPLHNLIITCRNSFNQRRTKSLVFHFIQSHNRTALGRCHFINLLFGMCAILQ